MLLKQGYGNINWSLESFADFQVVIVLVVIGTVVLHSNRPYLSKVDDYDIKLFADFDHTQAYRAK